VFELQRVRPDHASAILAFELANRGYFTKSISDRGDDYFAEFEDRHRALLAEQEAGLGVFHVLLDDDGNVVGRFNLYDVAEGTAVVGYRVAERAAGRGVATAALRDLVELARVEYGLEKLRAVTSDDNLASQKVLANAGFVPVGPAQIANRPGVWFELTLSQRYGVEPPPTR